jgi:HPt (histidine-containing phosphotransfer) domain-containing protein
MFSGIEGLDAQAGLSRIGNMEEVYIEILEMYAADIDERIPVLTDSFDKNDMRLFATTVHALKSASKSAGADGIADDASMLEDAAKESDTAFIENNLGKFLGDIENMAQQIKSAAKTI